MEIPAASISQIQRLRDGALIAIDDDVCGVVSQLQEIDSGLRVRWSEATELFVLYYVTDEGEEQLVCTTPELDGRLVQRVREISAGDYGYAEELDRLDAEARRKREQEFQERMDEAHERLGWAIKHDLKKGKPGPLYVPPDVY